MSDERSGAPGLLASVGRGVRGRCPRCGRAPLFGRFLKVVPTCEACGLPLCEHRADDLPPYIVIFLVGHIVGALILETELRWDGVPLWASMIGWPLLTLTLALALIQPVKGGVVGLQYALGMYGFARYRRADERAGGPPQEGRGRDGDDERGPGRADDFGRA